VSPGFGPHGLSPARHLAAMVRLGIEKVPHQQRARPRQVTPGRLDYQVKVSCNQPEPARPVEDGSL